MNGRGNEDAFLARWAARKSEALRRTSQDVEPSPEPERLSPAAKDESTDGFAQEGLESGKPMPEDLKDVDPENLDPETTDFSRFLKEDVPERLQRAALRRLWSSDETLANLDGLNDYDEDFTPAGIAAAAADFFKRTAESLLEDEGATPPDARTSSPISPREPETATLGKVSSSEKHPDKKPSSAETRGDL